MLGASAGSGIITNPKIHHTTNINLAGPSRGTAQRGFDGQKNGLWLAQMFRRVRLSRRITRLPEMWSPRTGLVRFPDLSGIGN